MLIMNKNKIFIFTLFSIFLSSFHWIHLAAAEKKIKKPPSPHEKYFSLFHECSSITQIGGQSLLPAIKTLKKLSKTSLSKKRFLAIDQQFLDSKKEAAAKTLAKQKKIDFTFWRVNDAYIEIESTDLLYLDGLRTYYHLSHELNRFSKNVRKYICIPRLSLKEENGETEEEANYCGNYSEYPVPLSANKRGIGTAGRDFIATHREWVVVESAPSLSHEEELLILKRINQFPNSISKYHKKLNYFLKNKIILCTGPSFGRYQMLKETVESELHLIPYKKIFLATNDPTIPGIRFLHQKPVCQLIENRDHHTDCYACIVKTLTDAANDPDIEEDDIIIFHHESLFINDIGLIKRAINKFLTSGCHMVCRDFQECTTTDVFMIKVSAVRKLLKDSPEFSDLSHNVSWCELLFTHRATKKIPNVFSISLTHTPLIPTDCSYWKETALGFYHRIPSYMNPLSETDCKRMPWWDKRDYDQLFE